MAKTHGYHSTKIRSLIQITAGIIKKNPELADNYDYLMAQLQQVVPALKDPTKCVGCEASMAEYANKLDINVALLLLNMGKLVRERALKIPFTEANKVRVSTEQRITHTQKCGTTRASKLGLIAKAGKSQWSITGRGFEALRGEAVPKIRIIFRGQILERPEELITLRKVFEEYRNKMTERERKGRLLRNDNRTEFSDYDPSQWVHIAGYQQGAII